FWYRHVFRALALAGGFLRIAENEIGQIPIPLISERAQRELVSLVDRILEITSNANSLNDSRKRAKVREYEVQIDQVIYKVYGLDSEDIKIVEANAAQSPESTRLN